MLRPRDVPYESKLFHLLFSVLLNPGSWWCFTALNAYLSTFLLPKRQVRHQSGRSDDITVCPPFSPRRSTRQEFHVSCKMSVQFREEKLRKISWERFLQPYEELGAVQKQSEICAQQKPNAAITPRKNIDDTHANTPTNERKHLKETRCTWTLGLRKKKRFSQLKVNSKQEK